MYSRQFLPSGQYLAGIRRDDGLVITEDPDDPLWQAYLAWLAAGNKPAEPPPITPSVPTNVTNYQARAVMRQFKMPDGRAEIGVHGGEQRAPVRHLELPHHSAGLIVRHVRRH
jgi:hypothetical protein